MKKETPFQAFQNDFSEYMKEKGFRFASKKGLYNDKTGDLVNSWSTLRMFEKALGINYKSEIMGNPNYEGTLKKFYVSKT